MYHVLIFHKGGQYSLDIAGEGGAPAIFSSLDDLVVFCMSHKMRMEGDEVGTSAVLTYYHSSITLCNINIPNSPLSIIPILNTTYGVT